MACSKCGGHSSSSKKQQTTNQPKKQYQSSGFTKAFQRPAGSQATVIRKGTR